MAERPLDPDELPGPKPPAPLPLRAQAEERLVDVVESAFYYLRRHPQPAGSRGEAERVTLLAHMERVLAENVGYPARPGTAAPLPPLDARIAHLVDELDAGRGAAWEELVHRAEREGFPAKAVEAALERLMDAGAVWEPVLGRLKRAGS